jgi:hypothetical protein
MIFLKIFSGVFVAVFAVIAALMVFIIGTMAVVGFVEDRDRRRRSHPR